MEVKPNIESLDVRDWDQIGDNSCEIYLGGKCQHNLGGIGGIQNSWVQSLHFSDKKAEIFTNQLTYPTFLLDVVSYMYALSTQETKEDH